MLGNGSSPATRIRPLPPRSVIPSRGADSRPTRVGLFGGTFDPPHVGHVTVATDVADALEKQRKINANYSIMFDNAGKKFDG